MESTIQTKQYIVLEIKKGESIFTFNMPLGATWGSAIDASFEVLNHITALSKEAVEKAKPVEIIDPEILNLEGSDAN